MSFQIPRGTQDILPEQAAKWQYIEHIARELCRRYNYQEIRTPIFEHTELFLRGVGDTTDIVQKEMYTFEDRGGRSLTLRPEGTAAVVRSFVENKMYGYPNQPVKLYYMGPMFRYERPQAGRFRQFVQFGVEALGSNDPAIDAEVIALAMDIYHTLGLKKLKLVINSLGDVESRKAHRQALIDHFQPRIHEFCDDCQARLHKNPMRILDCKKDRDHELMRTAPSILDYLNEQSRTYFEKVQMYLQKLGIAFEVDSRLVRGLDYYNHTAFEIMSEAEGFGAITTLCGGGRYNGLVQEIGGPETPGIGFALSIERLLAALEAEGISLPISEGIDCYVVALGEQAKEEAVALVAALRKEGISAEKDYQDRKVKAQLKAADRLHATYVAILGEDELRKGVINVKHMATGEQQEVPLDTFISHMKHVLK
ncbi:MULTISPECIES: histidine--tRNA ligase [Anoxybacillus]|uniref:Histidine--tRNA ligase n=1 Tax=Anoxybacillus flavithermus TaxID=33934 RepID=A0A178T7F5_9BACL|nr:histidine--tRNA ligase [Anoxybacillus flavithermus]ASA97853.1 histidine--tRNA ligase [Anoxybacillus flavithermus]ELK22679.1 histidyl-tRNA synthetase [Anoxybacillus flavithermus TNO-09.006]MBE2904272.1 histidine--tRNA ligase [Anoxybacillus flavithermus]MBE2906981.1 histidine--tRNA ligase [Anoxybacillus flavithermus]MBE2909600.1 histidine--tRNA ligase [Anoxybacillus flavithermus]